MIDTACKRIFVESHYKAHATNNTTLLTGEEQTKHDKYRGHIDPAHTFTPAIHNEHGRTGPQAAEMLRRMAATVAVDSHREHTDGGGITVQARAHKTLERFRATISIYSARSMAREVMRGALALGGGDG